jgi:2-desacetyl-2-hydroxyethyl bacteriochlorophyllide A dehydrogenase
VKAAVLERFGQPLTVHDVSDPEPGLGEVVVRTRASGICRTDLKIISGAIPTVPTPLVLGHELAGEVAALGPGVQDFREGDRVLVSLDVSCGGCAYCRIGELDHCANLQRIGLERDGSLAEFVRVPAANLIVVPSSVSFPEAATIPDAVGSPYHAVIRLAAVRPAQTVAVYGLGGLGLSAVQIARLAGARVIAIARTPERRDLAEQLGATWSVDPRDGPLPGQIKQLTDGLGVHAFFDFVGIEGSVEEAVLSSRKGGSVVVVGYVVPKVEAPMMRLVYDEISIKGSRGSTRADLHEVVALVADRRIAPVIGHELPLGEVNEALDQLREGAIIGRPVVTFP